MIELAQDDLRKLLAGGVRRVHLVGVGGSGMSGLARLMALRGHQVTGSDLGEPSDADALRQLGIQRFRGHAPEHVGNPDFVAYSSAIPSDNPELLEAESRDIPVVRRARALAALIPPQKAVVISGTHGKTTTSSMISHILRMAGKAPSFYVGAQVPDLGANASAGNGEYFVLEADESDGTMSEFEPQDLVMLNIEPEHLDFYRNLEAIEAAFDALLKKTKGRVIYSADDPGAARVAGQASNGVAFSIKSTAATDGKHGHLLWHAGDIRQEKDRTVFAVFRGGERLGEAVLIIPGEQNVSNALAALATVEGMGVGFEEAVSALSAFHGARRRFDVIFESDEFLVVDDYAHHPTEVKATIWASRQKKRGRVLAVFQPHRYTRVQALHREFGEAFEGADRVFLTDIYASSETPIEGVTGRLVADAVASRMGADRVFYEPDLWRLMEQAGANLRKGDLLLIMGAGNIVQISRTLAAELHAYEAVRKLLKPASVLRRYEPMSQRTTMRVGGHAKLWAEPVDEEDLKRLLRHAHERRLAVGPEHPEARLHAVTCVGRGSNLLVRDAGISGVTLHLGAPVFTQLRVEGSTVAAGAGCRLKQVVGAAAQAGLGGFEFLDGIPGTLGGALWSNAGAMSGAVCDLAEKVRMMDMEGNEFERTPAELGVGYRRCAGLRGHVVVSAVLKGRPSSRDEIERKIRDFDARRKAAQPVLPNAGCIFKNPREISAGRLIDELGMKNLRFGRARVSENHANFIVNDGGASASDVLNLISIVRDRVRREKGIELELEVEIVGDERR
ncbi:MAG: UDP-N-acetylmuramate--L-alanine ligase [Verrucomicrobiae bacterium]|nr:UDP-N-acetylmuramate--L-alanine ligase [Verrucomicrobiae bacterium]